MSQIQKKFIKSDAIDGSKIKLLNGESLRIEDENGNEVELLKLVGGKAFGPQGAFATQSDIDSAISAVVDSAPELLDTLRELAEALGNDPDFATTIMTKIGEIEAKNAEQDGRLDSAEATLFSHNTRIETVEFGVNNNSSRLDQVEFQTSGQETRLQNVEDKNFEQDNRIGNVEFSVSEQGLRIDAVENKNFEQDGRLDNVESSLSVATSKNDEQDGRLDSLESRMDSSETKNTEQDSRLSSVESKDSEQDDKIALLEIAASSSDSRMDGMDSKNAEQDGRLSSVESKDAEQDTRMSSIEADVSSTETKVNSLEAEMEDRFTALESREKTSYKNRFQATAEHLSFVDLPHKIDASSLIVTIDRLVAFAGYDYNLSEVNGVTRITWVGELASTAGGASMDGVSALAEGDWIGYQYQA